MEYLKEVASAVQVNIPLKMTTNRGADEMCGLRKVTGLWEMNSLLQKYINVPVVMK